MPHPVEPARTLGDPTRPVGEEARKSHPVRLQNGFIASYLSGNAILDIGYKGYIDDVVPIVPAATGVELDYPGYDGVTLPFDEGSQDAVFASHCLEHITDFHNAFRDWHRVLRPGGFLIIMVPHKFLYEKKVDLPSNYNGDHKRFYTPSSLMKEVEASLPPNSYRLRHLVDNDAGYDYALPPGRHSGGCYEIELVIEKIAPPAWTLTPTPEPTMASNGQVALPPKARGDATGVVSAPRHGTRSVRTLPGGYDVAVYSFGHRLPGRPRILALKLDHLGDFIIGLPSLRKLRADFPAAHIHLVVGSWNRAAAVASGLVDEVSAYDYFPQNGFGWDGTPSEPVARFRALTSGSYDIAIDLRVDDDTRFLLNEVDAATRCGIGMRTHLPYLDIALPPQHEIRRLSFGSEPGETIFNVERFKSRMPVHRLFSHETDFRPIDGHVIYGPHVPLPLGSFRVNFGLHLTGSTFGLRNAEVTVDVARDGEIVALKHHKRMELRSLPAAGVELEFENHDVQSAYEFRVHVKGKPLRAGLRFTGARLVHVGSPVTARYRQADLHIGEQLSLLVQLLSDRTALLYGPGAEGQPHPGRTKPRVVIAPISNSDLRDWPSSSYAQLIRLLVDRLDCTVALTGSRPQAAALNRIRSEAQRDARVQNLAGETPWPQVPDLLRQADLVICNNSGIAHLAASVGALTLAIYSASHQPQEWGPRGARSHAVMALVPCSPCGHDRLVDCPNEHACMRGMSAETVFQEAVALMGSTVGSHHP